MLLEISEVWDQLSDMNQAALLETMAGKMRGASVAAILQNPDLLKSAYYDAMNSTEGAGEQAIENSMDSIEKRLTQVKNAWMNIWQTSISSEGVKTILQVVEKLIEGLGKVLDLIGPINTGLIALGGITAFKKRGDILGFANIAKQLQDFRKALATNDATTIKSAVDKMSNDALNRALYGKEKGILNKALLSQNEINQLHGVYTNGQISRGKDATGKIKTIELPSQTASTEAIKAETAALAENAEAQNLDAAARSANSEAGLATKQTATKATEESVSAAEAEAMARLEAAGAIDTESAAYQNLIAQQKKASVASKTSNTNVVTSGIPHNNPLLGSTPEKTPGLTKTIQTSGKKVNNPLLSKMADVSGISAETVALGENTAAQTTNAVASSEVASARAAEAASLQLAVGAITEEEAALQIDNAARMVNADTIEVTIAAGSQEAALHAEMLASLEAEAAAREVLNTVSTEGLISTEETIVAKEAEAAAIEGEVVAITTDVATKEAEAGVTAAGTASNSAFAASFEALAAAIGISTAALGAFLIAAAGIAAAVIAYKKYQEVQRKQAEEAQKAASDYSDTAKSLKDYQAQYSSLQNQLAAAKGNATATAEVQSQILDLQNEINEAYGDTYGKINLVTDAYDNQTDVLDRMQQKAAKEYLRKNRLDPGVQDAERIMTKENTLDPYTTLLSGGTARSILEDVAKKNDAIKISDTNEGELKLSVVADPVSAVNAYNEIIDALEADGKKRGNVDYWSQAIKQIKSTATQPQELVDTYGEIYNQILEAEVQADPEKRSYYNELTDAVSEYQEAVFNAKAEGVDLLDSKEVNAAHKKLEDLQKNDLFKGKYKDIFKDIFDDADTSAYDFSKAISEDENGLKSAVEAVKNLTSEELASELEVPTNENIKKIIAAAEQYGVSIDEVEYKLKSLGATQKEVFSFGEMSDIFPNLEAYQSRLESTNTAVELLSTAMSELDSNGVLSTETFNSLNSATSTLKGALVMGANGYKLNTDKARELVRAESEVAEGELRIKQALAQQQYDVNQATIAKLNSELNKYSDYNDANYQSILASKNALELENSNIKNNIESYSQLAAQIHEATSAYNMWMSAQDGPDVGDQYDSIASGLESLKELYDDGFVGTEKFKTGVEALFPENEWDDDYYKKLNSWFTEGSEGADKFMADMSKVESEFGNIKKNADGSFDIDIGDLDKFLADANITETTWEGMMDRLSAYGAEINWDEPIDGINTVKDEMESLQETIELEKSLGLDTTAAQDKLDTLQEKLDKMEQLDKVNQAIEGYQKQLSETSDETEKRDLEGKIKSLQDKADELQGRLKEIDSQADTNTGGGSVNATATVDGNGNITVTVNVPNNANQGSGDESGASSEDKKEPNRVDDFNDALEHFTEEAKKASQYEAKSKYGNVDLTDRQGITWDDKTLKQYKSELESWGASDMSKGSISTVMGSWGTYGEEEIPIAFSPMLQTDKGAELLSSDTIDKYIGGLISKASADGSWTNEELLSLDAEGMEVDGKHISNIIADIGDTAEETSEAMHFMGNTGEMQMSFDDLVSSAAKAGISLNDLMSMIGEIPPTIDTSILAEYYGNDALAHLEELQATAVSVNEDGDIVIETTAETEESQKKLEELGITGAEVEGHTITIHTDVDSNKPTVPTTSTTGATSGSITPRTTEASRTSPAGTPLVNATNIVGGGASMSTNAEVKITADNTQAIQKMDETKSKASEVDNTDPVVKTDATTDAKDKLTDTSKVAKEADGKEVTFWSWLKGTAKEDTETLKQTADSADGKDIYIDTHTNPAAEQGLERVQSKAQEVDGENAEVTATAEDNATPILDWVLSALANVSNTPATAEVNAEDNATPTISSVQGEQIQNKTFNINANAGHAISSTGNVKSILGQIKDKAVTVTATTVGLDAMQSLKDAIAAIKSKVVTITAKKKTEGSDGGSGAFGTARIAGSARVRGSAYARGSSGKWGIPKSEKDALVGELGQELVVAPHEGMYYTVGDSGAEFVDLPKDAIVFNHRQTESILKNRKINSRGRAVVNGSAYARGNVPLSGPAHAKSVTGSYKSSSSSSKKSSSSSSTKKNTSATNANTSAKNSNTESTDDNTSALDKLKEQFDNLYDWIEVFVDRTENIMSNLETQAENTTKSWQTRNSYLQQDMDTARSFYNDLSASYNKYIAQADASGLSESYKDKVRKGRKNEIENIDSDSELRARVDEYAKW